MEDLVVALDAPLKLVLDLVDRNCQGVAFVVDRNGRIAGVATDGDIRRAFLRGATLDTSVSEVMTRDCITLPVTIDRETIFTHLRDPVRVIPLLDADNRPVDYASFGRHHRIPVAEPSLNGREFEYVSECLKTNWISSQGAYVSRFEREFAAYTGAAHAVAVSNGTNALHLALLAYGIGPGDEVIVPDLTFAASINAVIYTGATPVLVDVCPDTWCIDPVEIAKAIGPRTKAIMPVHLYGQPADMTAIAELAKAHGLRVIEDAAEALGAFHQGRHVGALGDAGIFSFFGNKLITTGEGGMVVFNDGEAAARARLFRDHGMDPTKRYWHLEVGYNYRLTNIQAAIGVAQLEGIDHLVTRKRAIAALYRSLLQDIDALTLQTERDGTFNIYWAFSIIVDPETMGRSRDELMVALAHAGIETRPLFYPLHVMPPYVGFTGGRALAVSPQLSANGLSLPSAVTLKDDEIHYICSTIRRLRKTWALKQELAG